MAANKDGRGLHKRKVISVVGENAAQPGPLSPPGLIDHLKDGLPEGLAVDLLQQFMAIRHDVATGTLERASPGKFVETVVQVLQWLERKSFEGAPKVDDYLKNLEARQASLHNDLRLAVARVARAMYTLRSKRSIVHKGGVDANVYDLRFLYASAQWVLSEIVRHVLGTDVHTASRLVEFIQLPAGPLVEDFGDRRLVLMDAPAREELLLLLRHYYPKFASTSQMHHDMDRRKPSTISHAIRAAWEQKLIEGDKVKGYKLTEAGYRAATELVKGSLSGSPVAS